QLLYINENVVFEGREQFEAEMRQYLNSLDEPVLAAINYSQDTDTESYLQRAQGGRPSGLPEGQKYVAITLVNIPGSVKKQILGPEELMGMKSLDELLERMKETTLYQDGGVINISYIFSQWNSSKSESTFTITGKKPPFFVRVGSKSNPSNPNFFSYNDAKFSITSSELREGIFNKSQIKWSIKFNPFNTNIFWNDKDDHEIIVLKLGSKLMDEQYALLQKLGGFNDTYQKIIAKVEAEIQKAKKEKSRQKLIELINYVNIKFLTEKFNVENRLNFITILLSEKLSIEAEKALLQVFQSFENKNEIIQLHVFLESEKIEGYPFIIKIIEGFSDINPFGINEDGNHIYFEKLLVSQWVVRYQDELPKDEDIKEYHATYPTSQGTQQYSWWDYQFNKNPATIIFTKGYQARDKPKKLVGNPQEYKLLSSIVPFYIAEKGEILYVPAIYGYMLSEWKKSRTAELTIEIFIGLIADVATDGLFRYLRTVKYLDEVGDVMGAKKIGGVVEGADDVLKRLNKSVVDDLNKLTPDTKIKMLNDIAADANFEKFVNDNPVISKAFSAHKSELTQLELTQIEALLKRTDIPVGAKSWASRGMRLRTMLVVSRQFDDLTVFEEIKRLYPNSYGRQITLKVTNKQTGEILEIVPDYLVRDKGKYKIVDAKYTSKAADDFELQKALTPNQDDVFGWLTDPKYKGKIEIEVRANNSKLTNLDLEQGEFLLLVDNLGIEVFQSQAGNFNAIEKIVKLK
ncbi:MAG: hypothetical protein ACOC4J_04555, partial [Bacteroidota bacterium]